MDNSTHQCVVFLKRILKAIENLHETNAAIAQYAEAAKHAAERQPASPFRAEVEFSPRVIHTYESQQQGSHRLQKRIFWVGLFTLIVLAAYTVFTFLLWRSSQASLEASNKSFAKTLCQMQAQTTALSNVATAAQTANAQAANADRPWFGTSISVDGFEVDKIPVATVLFFNSGRRPAKVIISEVNVHWFTRFPANPPYEHRIVSHNIVVPNSPVINKFNIIKNKLSQLEIDAATVGNPKFFIYSNIQYIDIGTGNEHHTHSCWVYIGNDPVLSKGFYNCTEYQDAD